MRLMTLCVLVVLAGLPAPAAPATRPGFENRASAAGVARKHTNRGFENPYAQIMQGYTALGAAAAAADYDLDGLEDLFVTDSQKGHANLLYRNNGDGTFSEVAQKAGVAAGNDAANASADALWFDYDGDGYPDLLVVRFGQNQLFHNRGDGTFEDVTARSGLSRYLNSVTAVAFDYDLDGDLDLFVGNYFSHVNLFKPDTPRFFPESFETASNGGGLTVYRNEGGGRFSDVTAQVGLVQSGWTLDLGHADADHDGDDDLYVAADFGTDRFYRNNGDGTFTDISATAIGVDTKKGMNTDWGDFDGDGLFDIYVTNITDEYMREGNFLWHNNGDLTFSDVSRETGTHNTGWGWAGKFFDFDNDGWLDLYVVNGWVSAGKENYVLDIFEVIVKPDIDLSDARNWPPMGNKTLSGYQNNALFHNQGGMLFKNVGAEHGVDSLLDGRGVVVADFNNDGRQDLFVTNAGREPFLFINTHAGEAHWVQFLLQGTRSNRDAIGARVWVTSGGRTQVSFVNGGNGFASQSSRRLHFGLAGSTAIQKVRVAWPSGRTEVFENVKVDRAYRIVEGTGRLADLAAPTGRTVKVGQAGPASPETAKETANKKEHSVKKAETR